MFEKKSKARLSVLLSLQLWRRRRSLLRRSHVILAKTMLCDPMADVGRPVVVPHSGLILRQSSPMVSVGLFEQTFTSITVKLLHGLIVPYIAKGMQEPARSTDCQYTLLITRLLTYLKDSVSSTPKRRSRSYKPSCKSLSAASRFPDSHSATARLTMGSESAHGV